MKAHEEDWRVGPFGTLEVKNSIGVWWPLPGSPEQLKLAAQAPAMARWMLETYKGMMRANPEKAQQTAIAQMLRDAGVTE